MSPDIRTQVVAALLLLALPGGRALAQSTAGAVAAQQATNVGQNLTRGPQALRSRDDLLRIENRRDRRQAAAFFKDSGRVRAGTEYGGWTSVSFLDIQQIDHSGIVQDPISSVSLVDNRAWFKHTWSSRRNVFLRLRKLDLQIETAPGVIPLDVRTKEQFDVDLFTYDFPVLSTDWRVGRQFLRVGRGLTLADTLDAVRVEWRTADGVRVTGFGGSTLHRSDNIDTNVLGFDQGHNNHTFIGIQGEYITRRNHHLTGYVLDQNDNSTTADSLQDPFTFNYDSTYVGLGSEGSLGERTIYTGELVFESGRAGTANTGISREQIDAGAAWLSLFHRLEGTSVPTLLFDYAWGSGDAGRFSVTDSGVRGPRSGRGDGNFIGFGRFDGGLALQPRLSNLHVIRFGFQFKPFTQLTAPSDFLLGFKLSDYEKSTLNGPISDPVATAARRHVGFGTDLFAAWKPLSDVDVLLEYGGFTPGDAYPIGFTEPTNKFAISATIAY